MTENAPPWPKQGPASYFLSIEKREPELHLGGAGDLFEYQSISQGGWVMLDVAGCAI